MRLIPPMPVPTCWPTSASSRDRTGWRAGLGQAQHCLLFSDVKANAIYRWDPHDGLRLFMRPSGYTGPEPAPMEEPGSNGLAFDREDGC